MMERPLVVIADMDEEYLATLEYKFLEQLGDQIDLEVISDGAYFQSCLNHPITAEIFIVDEEMYLPELKKHNIGHLFVLTDEQKQDGSTEDLSTTKVYKYMSIRELYNEVTYMSEQVLQGYAEDTKNTEVIAFYSAIGGCGKTSVSLALAGCLSNKHKRILYINTESVQNFAYYLKDASGLPGEGYRALREVNVYEKIKCFIREEKFSYLPPLTTTLDARNLSFEVYYKLIQDARDSGDYDYIFVDLESGYENERLRILQDADRVIMIVLQDEFAVYKTYYLQQCMDIRDREHYMFVCNAYNDAGENAYVQSDMQAMFPIKEYIERSVVPMKSLEQLTELEGIEKLSYAFI